MVNMNNQFKHLSLEQRKRIKECIVMDVKLIDIARELGVNQSSISREVYRNRFFKENNRGFNSILCINVRDCTITNLCGKNCKNYCKNCNFWKKCSDLCPNFIKKSCKRLNRWPYVCNGCDGIKHCRLDFYLYDPKESQEKYENRLVLSRKGIDLTVFEKQSIEIELKDKLKKNLSIESINSDNHFPVSNRTIRRYIVNNVFDDVKQGDLIDAVKYKKRNRKENKDDLTRLKRVARIGRELSDYIKYIMENPSPITCQLDTVEGLKKENGPFLMTLIIPVISIFICFVIKEQTTECVKERFNELYKTLGRDDYELLFKVILTDNGKEFAKPELIEFDSETGEQISHVFFCDPGASYQKAEIETCHRLPRRILPKHTSFVGLNDECARAINSHVNSYYRPAKNKDTAINTFIKAFEERGKQILKKLKIELIEPDKVNLSPSLISDLKDNN